MRFITNIFRELIGNLYVINAAYKAQLSAPWR
jgi:hypothetical protein